MVALVAAVMKREPARTDEVANEPPAATEPTPIPEVHLVAQTPSELRAGVLNVDGIELGVEYERLLKRYPQLCRLRETPDTPVGTVPDFKKRFMVNWGWSCGPNRYTILRFGPNGVASAIEGLRLDLGAEEAGIGYFWADQDDPPGDSHWQDLGPLTPAVKAALKKYGSSKTTVHLHYPDIGLTATFPSDRSSPVHFRLER